MLAQNGTPAPLVILNRHLGQADSDIAIHILQGGLSYVYDIYIYIFSQRQSKLLTSDHDEPQ